MMTKISYVGYAFLPKSSNRRSGFIFRFTLSFRDVEDLLAERGILVSYESVRRWVNHFGPMIGLTCVNAGRSLTHLASRRGLSENRWPHGLSVASRRRRGRGPRRAGPDEKEQARRAETHAQAFEEYGFVPDKLITDELRSYAAAAVILGSQNAMTRSMAQQSS